MANLNRPGGFSPVCLLNGSPYNGAVRMYSVASANTDALFVGDPVKSSGSADTNGIAGVALATAGTAIRGIITAIGTNARGGPYIAPGDLSLTSAPATKTVVYYVAVIDDPNVLFEVQEDTAQTALAAADVGLNIDFQAGTPGTGVKVSAFVLNQASKATTSTLNCKLLGLTQRSDNAIGTNAKWLVLINAHELRGGVTGV